MIHKQMWGARLFWGAHLGPKPDMSPFAQRQAGNRKEEEVERWGPVASRARTEVTHLCSRAVTDQGLACPTPLAYE